MKPFDFEDGSFASVAVHDGRAYLAFQTDPRRTDSQVRVYDLATERLVRAYNTGGGAAFPLLKPTGAPLMVAWRRADTWRIHYAEPLVDAEPSDLGDVGANNEPFAWDGDWLWWQDAVFQIKRANVVVGLGREVVPGQLGRGTGIARIVNGRAILRDFDRTAFGLTFPCYAAGCVALEGNTGGLVVVREADLHVARAWPALDCFTPKIVGWNDGVIAATSGSGSVRAVVLSARDFEDGPIVLPPPTTPPGPTPDPPKEPTPVPTAPNRFAVVQALHQEQPWLIRTPHAFTNAVAYRLWLDDPRWGHNIKRGNQGLSEDALAFKDPASRAGGVCIVDIIGAAGSLDPDKPPHPVWLDQTQATIDHGTIGAWSQPHPPEGVTPPAPGPGPQPPPQPPAPPAQSFPLPPDAELTRLSERLDAKYRAPREAGGLGRGPTETFVDPLGRARWMHDYFTHRGTVGEAEAWRRVNRTINDIVGLPGDLDPNP